MKKKLLVLALAAAIVFEGTGISTVEAAITNSSMDTAIEMTLDEEYDLELEAGEAAYHKFVPEESGNYTFKGVVEESPASYSDTCAELLDAEGERLTYNDDYYSWNQFGITYELEAGKTYYLKSYVYDLNEGKYTIVVEKTSFIAYASNSDVELQYGESETLSIIASSTKGDITYSWYYVEDGRQVDITDAISNTLTITGNEDTKKTYFCQVTDGTDTTVIYFFVTVRTGLHVENSDNYVRLEYGKSAVLTAVTTGGLENLTYQWYYYDSSANNYIKIDGATSQSYTVKGDANLKNEYQCVVSDGVEEATCYFYVTMDTGLALDNTYKDIDMKFGDTEALTVKATGGIGTLTYQWYYYDKETNMWNMILNAIGNTYTVTADNNVYEKYRCDVSDSMSTRECMFYMNIDTGWEIESSGGSQYIPAGMTKTMTVTTSETERTLSYQWYYIVDDETFPIEGATTSTYNVTADGSMHEAYRCEVTDGIKSVNAWFYVYSGQVTEWNAEKEYTITDEFNFFKITSTNKNAFKFYTEGENADSYAELFDANLNTITSCESVENDENFSFAQVIDEKDYYLLVRKWGEAAFTFKSEELGFAANAKGNSYVHVAYGDEATLEVAALSDIGTLSYQWYKYNNSLGNYESIENATSSSYTLIADENASTKYRCVVSNGTESIDVDFYVDTDTGLTVTTKPNGTVVVPYNGSKTVTLTATSKVDNLTYQWLYWDQTKDDFVKISDATSNSIVLNGADHLYDMYQCIVSDGFKTAWVYIDVEMDSGLTVYNSNEDEYTVEYGDSQRLRIIATSENNVLEYQWYYYDDSIDDYVAIKGATSAIYELLADVNAKEEYKCVVTDGISEKYKHYWVHYTGSIVDITKACTATLAYSSVDYDGTAKTPSVTVKCGDETLVKDKHYTVAYKNNTNAGTATVTITGIGKYTGTITKTFVIKEKAAPTATSIAKATVTLSQKSYTYDGKDKKPTVKVTLGDKTLVKDTDYTVSYQNNKNIGTATVTITGKGNYTGTVKATYEINIKVGKTYTVGSYKYKATSKSEVAFAGIKSTKTKKVVIASSVKIGGKTFKVTSVADKALQKKTKVTSVTVGKNVKKIGKNAFNGCKKLKTITIKSTKLKTVGKNALKGINAKAKIKVPAKKLKAYKKLLKGKGQGKKVSITK